MPATMLDISACINKLAPEKIAEDWDNVGLLVGDMEAEVSKILVALDISNEVISEALEIGADCIVTHHPIIFTKLKKITTDTPQGKKLIHLIKNNISVYAAHTNLDMAEYGTNDAFANMLGLTDTEFLCDPHEGYALGRVGNLVSPVTLAELANKIKGLLKLEYIGYMGDGSQCVGRIGILTGSGGDTEYINAALAKGCHVYVTSDIKYHIAQDALENGLMLIDTTHYAGEAFYMRILTYYLKERLNILNVDVVTSKVDGQLIKYI